jgi:hypothetical protein
VDDGFPERSASNLWESEESRPRFRIRSSTCERQLRGSCRHKASPRPAFRNELDEFVYKHFFLARYCRSSFSRVLPSMVYVQ